MAEVVFERGGENLIRVMTLSMVTNSGFHKRFWWPRSIPRISNHVIVAWQQAANKLHAGDVPMS